MGYNNASVAVFEPFIVISESSVPALVRWLIHVPSDYPRPVPRASSPTNLGPGNASGEARAIYRYGTSPLAFVRRPAEDQPVFCRPAATPGA